jgi:hypothetical protein
MLTPLRNRFVDGKGELLYYFFMKSKFQKVSDVLSTLMKGYGLAAKTDEYRILKIWDVAVGDKISSHTQPLRLIRGILTVVVDSPAWMQQISFYKTDLIDRINNELRKDVVTDINFRIGKVETKKRLKTHDPGLKTDISLHESKKIEGFLEPIKDEKIRETIRKAMTKSLTIGKGKNQGS